MNHPDPSRRSFLTKVLGLAGAAVLLKSAQPLAAVNIDAPPPPAPQDSAKGPARPLTFLTDKQAGKLSETGDYETYKFNGKKILFARISDKEIIAVDAACTHEGCGVKYKKDLNQITCWCHGSVFDLAGKVVKGPAQTPLNAYAVTFQDGKIGIAL